MLPIGGVTLSTLNDLLCLARCSTAVSSTRSGKYGTSYSEHCRAITYAYFVVWYFVDDAARARADCQAFRGKVQSQVQGPLRWDTHFVTFLWVNAGTIPYPCTLLYGLRFPPLERHCKLAVAC